MRRVKLTELERRAIDVLLMNGQDNTSSATVATDEIAAPLEAAAKVLGLLDGQDPAEPPEGLAERTVDYVVAAAGGKGVADQPRAFGGQSNA